MSDSSFKVNGAGDGNENVIVTGDKRKNCMPFSITESFSNVALPSIQLSSLDDSGIFFSLPLSLSVEMSLCCAAISQIRYGLQYDRHEDISRPWFGETEHCVQLHGEQEVERTRFLAKQRNTVEKTSRTTYRNVSVAICHGWKYLIWLWHRKMMHIAINVQSTRPI